MGCCVLPKNARNSILSQELSRDVKTYTDLQGLCKQFRYYHPSPRFRKGTANPPCCGLVHNLLLSVLSMIENPTPSEIELSPSETLQTVLSKLSEFDGNISILFAARSSIADSKPFDIHDGIVTVAKDIRLSELGDLLAQLTNKPHLADLRSIMARRFAIEGHLLSGALSAIHRPDEPPSITQIVELLNETSGSLLDAACSLNPQLAHESGDLGTDASLVDRQQTFALLGIDEHTISDRANRLSALLMQKEGEHVVNRYYTFLKQRIACLFTDNIQKAMTAELALASALPTYQRLPSRIQPPDGYWLRNEDGYQPDSLAQDDAVEAKKKFRSFNAQALTERGIIQSDGNIDLRVGTTSAYESLTKMFEVQINTIAQKRRDGTLTQKEEDDFISVVTQEINKYDGWGIYLNAIDHLKRQFDFSRETSPARAIYTGQMHCAIRAVLLGQMLMDTGKSDLEVMSLCIGRHAGLIIKQQDGGHIFIDYSAEPSYNKYAINTRNGELVRSTSLLEFIDVALVQMEQSGIHTHAGKESVRQATIHRGLKGIACVAYATLGQEMLLANQHGNNAALMEIVTTIDPLNLTFREAKARALAQAAQQTDNV